MKWMSSIKLLVLGGSVFFLLYMVLALNTPYSSYLVHRSVQNQIVYLQNKFIQREDLVLQDKYPEGLVFSNALFALSLIEEVNNDPIANHKLNPMIDACILRLVCEEATSNFNENLSVHDKKELLP